MPACAVGLIGVRSPPRPPAPPASIYHANRPLLWHHPCGITVTVTRWPSMLMSTCSCAWVDAGALPAWCPRQSYPNSQPIWTLVWTSLTNQVCMRVVNFRMGSRADEHYGRYGLVRTCSRGFVDYYRSSLSSTLPLLNMAGGAYVAGSRLDRTGSCTHSTTQGWYDAVTCLWSYPAKLSESVFMSDGCTLTAWFTRMLT